MHSQTSTRHVRDTGPFQLAESAEPNRDASEWTIRLRDGVRFHNGKPLTADDAIFSLRYIGRPKSPSAGALAVRVIDLKRLKKLDRLTFRAPLVMPIAQLQNWLGPNGICIVPDGTTSFDPPVGTGPYIFVSWTKGQSSLFRRNPDYWYHPLPYTDELVLESLPEPTTRINALLSGEVDAASSIAFSDAKHYLDTPGAIQVMVAKTPGMVPMTMAVNVPPFNDVRVRQAMRLIADRPALVEDVTYGLGQVGNDVFGIGEQFYDSSLPQRHQDIDQAKSLLKAAGRENLSVQLNTSSAVSGMLESATLFAQQATAAGVTVKLHQYPASSYFDPPFLSWGFGQDYFTAVSIPAYMAEVLLSKSPYNETHWRNAGFDKVYYDALGDLDDTTATQKWAALQKIQYEQGGFLIWGTTAWVDGLSPKIQGAKPSSYSNLSAGQLSEWSLA
jgi:peptide/nickel transport system substrate-binding protein